MSKVYSFVEQLEKGHKAEKILDEYFSKWYLIADVSMDTQRKGIDRIFTRQGSAEPIQPTINVEYKADERTQETGNVFIETMSVMEMGKYGWAWSSQADMLVYLAIPDTLYIVPPVKIREIIGEWTKKFGLRTVRNKAYKSCGIPVPEEEFAKICSSVRRLT